MVVTVFPLLLRTAVHREIPFQEVAASIQAVACLRGAAVAPVVVREGMLLVTGVVVLVCKYFIILNSLGFLILTI